MARAKLIALIGEPKNAEAAIEIVRTLPRDAALVTRNLDAFAAAAFLLHPMRTLERVRSDKELAEAADEVIDLSKPAPKAAQAQPVAAMPASKSSAEEKD